LRLPSRELLIKEVVEVVVVVVVVVVVTVVVLDAATAGDVIHLL